MHYSLNFISPFPLFSAGSKCPLSLHFLDFIYSPAKCGYACVSGKSVCRSNTILPPNALRRPPNSISVRRGNFHSSNIVSGKRARLSRRKSVLSAHIVADGKGEVSLIERCTSLNYAFSHINYFSPPNSSQSATSPQSSEICCSHRRMSRRI